MMTVVAPAAIAAPISSPAPAEDAPERITRKIGHAQRAAGLGHVQGGGGVIEQREPRRSRAARRRRAPPRLHHLPAGRRAQRFGGALAPVGQRHQDGTSSAERFDRQPRSIAAAASAAVYVPRSLSGAIRIRMCKLFHVAGMSGVRRRMRLSWPPSSHRRAGCRPTERLWMRYLIADIEGDVERMRRIGRILDMHR